MAVVWIGLEGCDGTGKSTLAAAVRDELERIFGSAELLHRGPPERDVLEEYVFSVEGREDENLVFDRWHLGTLVYAPLYRDTGPYGELGVAGFRWVEKFLQARGARFYVVDLPYELVAARLEARGEDYLQSHHVEQVLARFRQVNDMSVVSHDAVFTPSDDISLVPKMAEVIVDDAVEHAAGHEALRAYPSYVGPLRPSALLVGEKRGGQPPFVSQACFGPLKNKSGEYLWEALHDPFWRTCGAANAYEDDVPSLWKALGEPPVVALGREAAKALDAAGIDYGAVPHPAYIKRFHHRWQTEYGGVVQQVAVTEEKRFTWPN